MRYICIYIYICSLLFTLRTHVRHVCVIVCREKRYFLTFSKGLPSQKHLKMGKKKAPTTKKPAATAAEKEDEDDDLGPLEDISPHLALQKWSSDVVNRLGATSSSLMFTNAQEGGAGFNEEDFDKQLENLIAKNATGGGNNNSPSLRRNASTASKSSQSKSSLSSGARRGGGGGRRGDPIKSGDLAHLGFPFDGAFGKDELKESLREAFREVSDVKAKAVPESDLKGKKKTNGKSAPTTKKKNGDGVVVSLDDAWARINGGFNKEKTETTLEDAVMDVVAVNNATMNGARNINRTSTASLIMAQRSLFSAGAQDLAHTLGVAHTLNATSMEQMAKEANLSSYDTEVAKMLSTFGSGSGSGGNAFDGHVKKANYHQALERQIGKNRENGKKPTPTKRKRKEEEEEEENNNKDNANDNDAAVKTKQKAKAEVEMNKKKRKVTKTNVPRVEIDNTRIVELTKENKNLIVTPGGIKDALPPRKKGRRPNNPTVVETEEETRLRAEERVYKNRQSAARSRARKLKTIAELQEEINRLTCENDTLRELCKGNGVTEAKMTRTLEEAEATRQKEKKDQEELDAKVKQQQVGSSPKTG